MKMQSPMRGASTLKSVSRKRSGVGRVFKPGKLLSRRLRNSPAITRMSSYLDKAVAALPMLANIGDRAAQLLIRWRTGDERLRLVPSQFEYIFIANDIGDA